MPGTVLRYLDSRPVSGPVSFNIAAHIFRWGGISRPTRLSDKYCAAILPVLGLDPASGVRYRSTHLPVGQGLPSDPGCLTSSVLRYLDFRPPPGPVSFNIAAQYSRLRIPGGPEIWSLAHAPGWASKSVDYFRDVQ